MLPGVIFNQEATKVICQHIFQGDRKQRLWGKHADRLNWQIVHFSVLSTSYWAILSDSMDQRLRTTCGYCCRCRKFGLTEDSFHNRYHSCYYSCDNILSFFFVFFLNSWCCWQLNKLLPHSLGHYKYKKLLFDMFLMIVFKCYHRKKNCKWANIPLTVACPRLLSLLLLQQPWWQSRTLPRSCVLVRSHAHDSRQCPASPHCHQHRTPENTGHLFLPLM